MATHLVTVVLTVEVPAEDDQTPWDCFDLVQRVLESPARQWELTDGSWSFGILEGSERAIAAVAPETP